MEEEAITNGTMNEDKEFGDLVRERFAQLPRVVQDAITSADVAKRLRDLAGKHKLHIDQWETLENEVQLTLLGVKRSEDLPKSLQTGVGVSQEAAVALATDISEMVFEPIREELERQLDHPSAKTVETTGVEDMSAREMTRSGGDVPLQAPATSAIAATPPAPLPTEKVARAPFAESYHGTASHERKAIEGDPYREQLSP